MAYKLQLRNGSGTLQAERDIPDDYVTLLAPLLPGTTAAQKAEALIDRLFELGREDFRVRHVAAVSAEQDLEKQAAEQAARDAYAAAVGEV